MTKLLQTRVGLFLIGILVIPFTFYWANGNFSAGFDGLDSFTSTIEYVSSESIIALSAVAYLLVFFAFLTKTNGNLRTFLVFLSASFELMMILEFSKTLLLQNFSILKTLKTVFINSQDVAPLQVFNSLAVIIWSILIYKERYWLRQKINNLLSGFDSNFMSNKLMGLARNKYPILILAIALATMIFSGISGYGAYRDATKLFDPGFNLELLFIAINLVLTMLVEVLLVFVFLLFLFDTRTSWLYELHNLAKSLLDFKLSRYVTRVVSGYLYWIYTISVVATLALMAPMITVVSYLETASSLDSGFKPELALIIVGVPALSIVIGYIFILILRIIFELAVALVHIAENTRSKN